MDNNINSNINNINIKYISIHGELLFADAVVISVLNRHDYIKYLK
jgi:hypothetical protein